MPFGYAAGALVVGSAINSYDQQRKAANQQQDGITAAQAATKQAAGDAYNTLAPVVQTGVAAGQQIAPTLDKYQQEGATGINTLNGQTGPLNVNQFLDPSMKFQEQQGAQTIQDSAAARGGLLSGATLKSLAQYSNNLASTNYTTAANLALQDRGQQANIGTTQIGLGDTALNAGLGLYNQGVGAIGNQANIISGQGQDNANLAMTSGNVAARGTIAQANTVSNTAGTLAGMFSDENAKVPVAASTAIPAKGTSPTLDLKTDPNGTVIGQVPGKAAQGSFTNIFNNWGAATLPQGGTNADYAKLQSGDTRGLTDTGNGGYTRTIYYMGQPLTVPISSQFGATPTVQGGAPQQSGGIVSAATGALKDAALGGGDPILGHILGGLFSDENAKGPLDAVSDSEIDDFLSKLNPKEFQYNDKAQDAGAPAGPKTGVLAQDVEKSKIGKRLVSTDPGTGYKQIDVPQTVGTLLATAASLNTRLKAVEGKKK